MLFSDRPIGSLRPNLAERKARRAAQQEQERQAAKEKRKLEGPVLVHNWEVIPGAMARIYTRCSHRESADSGLGLDSQYDTAVRYFEVLRIKFPGLELDPHVYQDEAVSAYRGKMGRQLVKRPEGRKLHEALQPGDHVIIARLDRAFRWPPDFHNTVYNLWMPRGIRVHIVDLGIDLGTAIGMMMAGVISYVACWQSAYISERTKEALRQKRIIQAAEDAKCPKKLKARQNHMIIVRWIRWARDQAGLSLDEIRRRIEKHQAKLEGRPVRPLFEHDYQDRMDVLRAYRSAEKLFPERYHPNRIMRRR